MTTTTSSSAATTTSGSTGAIPAGGSPAGPRGPAPAVGPSVRQRRNPRLAALGAVLLTLGGLTGGYLFTQGGQTEAVVMLTEPITAGKQITEDQLGTAQLPVNTGLDTTPAADIGSIKGKYATVSLPKGSLLSAENVQPDLFPPVGKSVVGVALKPSQAPARGLLPGDSVRLVVTATSGAAAAPGEGDQTGTTWAATVLTSGARSDDGTTTVDFVIDTKDSTNLAAAAGAGNVAVILDPLKKG